jgi:capsular polysaccharide biosynthesis protein/Mrp family chromosome partitioning ATPase
VNEDRAHSGRYLRALREHWPYIAGTAVIALVASLVFVGAAQKRYEAGVDVLISPVPPETLVGLPLFRDSTLSRSVVTAARLVTSPQVVDGVEQRLRVRVDRQQLLSHVSVTPQEQSSIVTITGKASTPQQAARVANAFADVLISERSAQLQRAVRAAVARLAPQVARLRTGATSPDANSISDQLASLQALVGAPDPTLSVVSPAVAPDHPAWPRPLLSVLVALLVGLLLGMGIAIALEIANPLVLAESDVAERSLPVLGRVPGAGARAFERGALPRSLVQYRGLWSNVVARADSRRESTTILVADADHGETSADVAVGLAAAAALAGRSVVLADFVTRSQTITRLADGAGDGLGAVLGGDVEVDDALVPSRLGDRLRVLTAGRDDAAMLGMVPPERLQEIVGALARLADVAVVAAPPPQDVPDVVDAAGGVDAVLLVVQLGRTRRELLDALLRDLSQRRILPVGFAIVARRRVGRSAARRRRKSGQIPRSVLGPAHTAAGPTSRR